MAGCPICEDLHHGASGCPHSLVGSTLGKYRVTEFLAAGGMGAVYTGEHQTLGSPVAVKTLHRALLPQNARTHDRRQLAETLVQRFTDEARRAASLRHQNIVRVEDLGVASDGTPYLAMEYLEGMSLKELVETSGPLDPGRAAELIAQALDALEFAHQRNIVHRDIKPENLYLEHPGERTELVKVLDFGIAKAVGDGATQLGLTQTGHGAMGTFYYMSPEQAKDPRRVTAGSDVFSVGASLFELLTGRTVLFEVERELTTSGLMAVQFIHGVLSAIIEGNIERHPHKLRPEIPEWLDAIVARSLAHDPSARFASAGQMASMLHAGAAGEAMPAAPPVALAATAPSQPMPQAGSQPPAVPRTQVAPPVPEAERPSARMAGRAATPEPASALGSTTGESAGQKMPPPAPPQPLAPSPSSKKVPLLIGAAVALLGAAAAVAVVASGSGGESPSAAAAADAGAPSIDATVAVVPDAAADPGFDEIVRLAKDGDCASAAAAYGGITDSADAAGRAGALVALGSCERAADQRDSARVRFERALAIAPEHPDATAALAKLDAEDRAHPPGTDSLYSSGSRKSRPAEKPAPPTRPSGIRVNAKPRCVVFIDGKRAGKTPLRWVEVKPGRHKLTLVNREHGIRQTFSVRVKPGEKKSVIKDYSDQVKVGAKPEPDNNGTGTPPANKQKEYQKIISDSGRSGAFSKAYAVCGKVRGAVWVQKCLVIACRGKNKTRAQQYLRRVSKASRDRFVNLCKVQGVHLTP